MIHTVTQTLTLKEDGCELDECVQQEIRVMKTSIIPVCRKAYFQVLYKEWRGINEERKGNELDSSHTILDWRVKSKDGRPGIKSSLLYRFKTLTNDESENFQVFFFSYMSHCAT